MILGRNTVRPILFYNYYFPANYTLKQLLEPCQTISFTAQKINKSRTLISYPYIQQKIPLCKYIHVNVAYTAAAGSEADTAGLVAAFNSSIAFLFNLTKE